MTIYYGTTSRRLSGAFVLDPAGRAFTPATVVVEGSQIVAVEDPRPVPGAETIDLAGLHLIPGLIDAHCHLIERSSARPNHRQVAAGTLEGARASRNALELGVTTVRDAGTRHEGIYALRDANTAKPENGPAIFAAGRNISGPAVPPDWRATPVTSTANARRQVRKFQASGADWIKLVVDTTDPRTRAATRLMGDAEIAAAIQEAHSIGLRVGAHCESGDASRAAVAHGADSIEHGHGLCHDILQRMIENGTMLVPTLAAYSASNQRRVGQIDPHQMPGYEVWIETTHRAGAADALAAGVRIAAGSDGGYHHEAGVTIFDEAQALTQLGMTPCEVLAACTITGARLIGDETRGTITAGAAADVVGLREDPLKQPIAPHSPAFVMHAGVVVLNQCLTRTRHSG